MSGPRLAEVALPDFGMPDAMPEIPAEVYQDRLRKLKERALDRGYDFLVVYADREHSANLSYLTGFDPRFEEAVLIVGPTDEPAILVGNECYGMAGAAPLSMRRHLFQDLSLPGQPRDRSRSLPEILAYEGIHRGSHVGILGWKYYSDRESMEVPAFIVDLLRRLTGPTGTVENANDLLIGAADGLRVINEVEQLAAFEYAACQTSNGVRQVHSRFGAGDDRAGGGSASRMERDAVVVSSDADRRSPGLAWGCSAPATGPSSAVTGSRLHSGYGAP